MEVLRSTDCSYLFTFTEGEDVDTDIDHFRWKEVAAYFISLAKQLDPEGDFVLIEDFDSNDGSTIGYTALRGEPLMVSQATYDPVSFPSFSPDFAECEYPDISEPIPLPQQSPSISA